MYRGHQILNEAIDVVQFSWQKYLFNPIIFKSDKHVAFNYFVKSYSGQSHVSLK